MTNPINLVPLRTRRDYEAARDRLAELEEMEGAEVDDFDDEANEEAEALQALVDDFADREGVDDDESYELAPRLKAPEPAALATFKLSNGNEVRFLGAPGGSEIMMTEIAQTGAEDLILGADLTPLMAYRLFAPASQAVPRMLARLDTLGEFEGRKIVEALDKPLDVALDRLGVTTAAAAAGGQGSCQPGAAGAAYFDSHHCGALGGPGYGKSESYCFKNASTWIHKTTSKSRRTTYSRMAACGEGTSRLRHAYKKVGGYHTQLTVDVSAKQVISFWSYKKGIKRKRRAYFDAISAGAWVRAWMVFHSEVAGGW